jgi:hypothetical protein
MGAKTGTLPQEKPVLIFAGILEIRHAETGAGGAIITRRRAR